MILGLVSVNGGQRGLVQLAAAVSNNSATARLVPNEVFSNPQAFLKSLQDLRKNRSQWSGLVFGGSDGVGIFKRSVIPVESLNGER